MSATQQEEDEMFLAMLKANDVRAMDILYESHYRPVYRVVRKFIHDDEASKDVVQLLFTAIWEKRDTLNITSPVRKYLLSAAHNRSINYSRNRVRDAQSLGEALYYSKSQDDLASDRNIRQVELHDKIRYALSQLPINTRKVFVMSRFLGMSNKELAAHFSVSEKAIEKTMTKALKLLRFYLSDYLKVLILASLLWL